MKWVPKHAHLGTEFDWLALDDAQHLGYVSTAGFGPIPTCVLAVDEQEIDEMVALLRKLPPRSRDVTVRPDSYNVDDWIEMAKRGVFAYDWDHYDDVYKIIAVPLNPLSLNDVADGRLREHLRRCRIPGSFDKMSRLLVSAKDLSP